MISTAFHVQRQTSIPSDGTSHKVNVVVVDLQPTFQYETVPSKVPYSFLKAKVTNTSQYPFLAGPVSVFLDNNFIAKVNELETFTHLSRPYVAHAHKFLQNLHTYCTPHILTWIHAKCQFSMTKNAASICPFLRLVLSNMSAPWKPRRVLQRRERADACPEEKLRYLAMTCSVQNLKKFCLCMRV